MITFSYNKRTFKLQILPDTGSKEDFDKLREHFSVVDETVSFKRRVTRRYLIPGRQYIITPAGRASVGMLWAFVKYLKENTESKIVIDESLRQRIDCGMNVDVLDNLNLKLRDYQYNFVKSALNRGFGTYILGTGGGKTLITASIIENYYQNSKNKEEFKCLIIVPDLGLVSQTYSDFKEYGVSFKMSKWTGGTPKSPYIPPSMESNVIICNAGILRSRYEENDWVNFVDVLIVDEGHRIKKDKKISKIVTKIRTGNKYALTGTLPEENIHAWHIIGEFGPIFEEKSSSSLREEDYLVNISALVLNLEYNTHPRRGYRQELEYIYNNKWRNNIILDITTRLTGNMLVLVNHIAHGEVLYDTFSKVCEDYQIFFIQGSMPVDERRQIHEIMEKDNNVVCIAMTSIFSTGINVKNIPNIMFTSGGKSFIRTVQSIGRGLRKHPQKEKLRLIDISDNLHYSQHHKNKRLTIYQKENIPFSEKTLKQP